MVGVIALILSAMTHWVSKLLAFEMLVAVTLMYFKNGMFDHLAPILFAAAFSLMITGAGKYSLDMKTGYFDACKACLGDMCKHV